MLVTKLNSVAICHRQRSLVAKRQLRMCAFLRFRRALWTTPVGIPRYRIVCTEKPTIFSKIRSLQVNSIQLLNRRLRHSLIGGREYLALRSLSTSSGCVFSSPLCTFLYLASLRVPAICLTYAHRRPSSFSSWSCSLSTDKYTLAGIC
jgi:hypothetical protein